MFGNNSSGFANENQIIEYLNTTRYFDNLNDNFKSFLTFTFDRDLRGKIISASKPSGQVKPDIIITTDNENKYISVKKGSGNSVHQEQLSDFESFLSFHGVSRQIINYLKEFHYGDGSIDGNGGTRIRASQWQAENLQKITQINAALNSQAILRSALERFLFVGNIPNAPTVDTMYHGNINEGLWANATEIINYLIPNNNHSTTIHFSNLTYQVWNRNLKHNPNTENRRHTMQIKWPTLTNDFINITDRRL